MVDMDSISSVHPGGPQGATSAVITFNSMQVSESSVDAGALPGSYAKWCMTFIVDRVRGTDPQAADDPGWHPHIS